MYYINLHKNTYIHAEIMFYKLSFIHRTISWLVIEKMRLEGYYELKYTQSVPK